MISVDFEVYWSKVKITVTFNKVAIGRGVHLLFYRHLVFIMFQDELLFEYM